MLLLVGASIGWGMLAFCLGGTWRGNLGGGGTDSQEFTLSPTTPIGLLLRPARFVPSVMMGSGAGLRDVEPSAVPGLADFLQQKVGTFRPDQIPEDAPLTPANTWTRQHLYLFYTIGCVWRVFGVSWTVFRCLLLVVFCIIVVAVYGLLRLSVNRFLGVLGALVFARAPWVIAQIPHVRDLCKAAFMFPAILVMGYMVSRRCRPRTYVALAAVLGLLIGIGSGFRGDVNICAIPGLLVVAFSPCAGRGKAVVVRVCACMVMLVALMTASFPISRSHADAGTVGQDILVGMSSEHEENMALIPGSYEEVHMGHDNLAAAMACRYMQYGEGERETGPVRAVGRCDEAARKILVDIARVFPADVITRGFASVVTVLDLPWVNLRIYLGGSEEDAEGFPECLVMMVLAGLALLLLSYRDLRLACMALLGLLYFGAYPSLRFEARHAFHLLVIPIWILVYLVKEPFGALNRLRDSEVRRGLAHRLRSPRTWWTRGMKRMTMFALGAALLLVLPLQAARAYQAREVRRLSERYAASDLEPVVTSGKALGDWIQFFPSARETLFCGPCDDSAMAWHFRHDYMAVEFQSSPAPREFWIMYEAEAGLMDFSTEIRLAPTGPDGSQRVKYFFPIYESPGCSSVDGTGWSRFTGIAVPQEHTDEFVGLFRVVNQERFPVGLSIAVPEDKRFFQPYHRLRITDGPLNPRQYLRRAVQDNDLRGAAHQARVLKEARYFEDALEAYQAVLASDPRDREALTILGSLLEELGQPEAACEKYREAMRASPHFSPPYDALDAVLRERGDAEQRVAEWRQIVEEFPEAFCAWFYLGLALEAAGDQEGAEGAFQEALSRGQPLVPGSMAADTPFVTYQGKWPPS